MASNRKYKCPFCKVHDIKEKLIYHIDKNHEDMIPEGFTAARVLFHYLYKKPYNEKGKCVICKGETDWNEKTYKYNRLCNRRECKEKLRENYKKNMLRVFGTYNILNDMNQQEKMLKNRSISGIYKFRNGKIKDYVGSYEKKFLEFCDIMLGFDPDDIMMPGPTIEYEYKGQKHQWITDALIIPYNLVLDVKDGNTHPNNRPMVSYREKQIEKEKVITNKGEYNYLRLTDNQFDQLIGIIYELKLQMLDDPNTTKTISRVHESTQPLFISEKDIEYRLDDFRNHKVPVLWITGMSGGGKTYTANKIADEMNCDVLELDNVIAMFNKIYDKKDVSKYFVDKNYKIIYECIKDDDLSKVGDGELLVKSLPKILSRYSNRKQLIIEGIQVPWVFMLSKNLFNNSSIIVKGTSVSTSILNRFKRAKDNGEFINSITNIYPYIKLYYTWYKTQNKFRYGLKKNKIIKESSDEEMDIKDLSSAKEQEYYKYLKIHEVRLKASFNDRIYALKNALLLSKEQCEELKERILKHDASRYTPEEWDNWRKSYFPVNDKEKEEGEKTEKEARKHHYKVNAHHPEHWNGKEMDKVSIAEMIIDWEADSKVDGGNPLKWWLYNDEAKEKKKLLNPKTREEVERVLQTIYDVNMNLKDNFDRIDDPKKAD